MDLSWIWKGILIVIVGTLFLRIAGSISISQMTVAQTVIMISIGTLIVQPATKQDIQNIIQLINAKLPYPPNASQTMPTQTENLFAEIEQGHYPSKEVPDRLQ